MSVDLTGEFHRLIDRRGTIVKREVVEGAAQALDIPVRDIPIHLDIMVARGWWGCELRDTIKRGWFDPASPEGTVCHVERP